VTDDNGWHDEYQRLEPMYRRLKDEATFAIEDALGREEIKLHSLTARIKTLESLDEKCQRKGYTSPLDQTPDIVGLRVVVLFLADLARVAEIVSSVFDVVSTEDKVEGDADPSTFGYMSQHFEALIPENHRGPRYEGLRGIRFEIQVRTLLMDAWANVSHHLAYKGESSIPAELRRDFHALSGLFYVADKHFEMFFERTAAVRKQTDTQLAADSDVPLNLDTLAAFLERRFPEREHASRAAVGELAEELLTFDFTSIAKVEHLLHLAADKFAAYEADRMRGSFSDVGVVRVSLSQTNPKYARFIGKKVVKRVMPGRLDR
jgi:putative GTP pyrophosphokinase